MSCAVRWSWIVVALAVAGCAKPEDYIEVVRETRVAYQELTEILETVKDEKTMADARAAIEKRRSKFESIARKAKALPKPPPPEVAERLKDEEFLMTGVVQRYIKQGARIERDVPGGPEFMKQFRSESVSIMSAVQP